MLTPVVYDGGKHRPLRTGETIGGVSLVEEVFADFFDFGGPLQLKYLPEADRQMIVHYGGVMLIRGIDFGLTSRSFQLSLAASTVAQLHRNLYISYFTREAI